MIQLVSNISQHEGGKKMLKALGLIAGVICTVTAVVGIKMLDIPEWVAAALTISVVLLGIYCLTKYFSFTDKKKSK
jgi:putative flippase GtrA